MTALVVAVFVALVALAVLLALRGPLVPKDLAPLREPRLSTLPAMRVLAVDAAGDSPAQAAGSALGKLFRGYFRTPGAPRRLVGAPRARWVVEPGGAARARFAIPVPDAVTTLPEGAQADGLRLDTWEYGEVAEILHVGGYDSERQDIDRLHRFMAESGVKPADDHEEEYVRGPGMFGPGNPRRYLTIIRYRVTRP